MSVMDVIGHTPKIVLQLALLLGIPVGLVVCLVGYRILRVPPGFSRLDSHYPFYYRMLPV